ncbi:hypothetical protein C8N35_11545 [Breoghania corrubedonensis]|uniref:Tail-like repeat protein n=1 Tax=Breoghania corrubedonensis TaxID=665038 RepID=A0A2T5UQY8_9HYPH|nr:hypothetical protein [Breoghania corrubedonensis]PTW53925.1 hypothetical protein C8N35_11545 [Breoghania corrubedonensis]
MPNRYGDYLIKRGDNLGDPSFWNRRFKDVDARIAANEDQRDTLDAVIEEGRVVFREKANDVLLPLINEVYEAANVGLMLRVTSQTEHQVATGGKTFIVDEGERLRYAPPAYVAIYRMESPQTAMLGEVVSWDAGTGELTVDIDRVSGAGAHGGWTITAASPSDTAEAIAEVMSAVDAVEADRQAAQAAADLAGEKADLAVQKADIANAFAAATSDDADRSEAAIVTLQALYAAQSRVFLGAFPTDPATDLNGDPLAAGAEYWNTVDGVKKIYDGSGWTVSYVPVGSEVTSIFGRTGNITAQLGDYSADKITAAAIAGLTGSTVQAVLGSIKGVLDTHAADIADRATSADLNAGLATKSDIGHTHAFADLTETPTTLAGYGIADARTGVQIAGDIAAAITGLADTAYVDAQIATLLGGAPAAALDTIAELAAALQDNDSDIAAILSSLATKLPAASYTAADVLAKLKTVDGAGSGLDADLVQGAGPSTANAANTLVRRDAAGDITARLLRSEFTGLNGTINYFMTQVAVGGEPGTNNYARPSSPAQAVAALNAAGGINAATLGGSAAANFVQSSRTISAGTGLTGGGNLSANRTLSINEATLADVTAGTNGKFPDAATLKAALAAARPQIIESDEIDVSATGAYTWAHGLGEVPKQWAAVLRCVVDGAATGHVRGAEVPIALTTFYNSSWRAGGIWADDTVCGMAYSQSSSIGVPYTSGTSNVAYLTDGEFKLVFRIWV